MKTQLDHMYEHELARADELWMTQPLGGGRIATFTFAQAMNETRRIAAHLASLGLPGGSRVAILSKNTAWWFMADLAIWMAGHVSVPIYPNLAAGTVRTILDHSGAKVILIGKLEGFDAMEPGIAPDLIRIVMPLGPPTRGARWSDLIASIEPLGGVPRRDPDDLATIMYTSGSTGTPKGVMHSFRTMGSARVLIERWGLTPRDRAISYLPLAHVAERACLETTSFIVGFRLFFAESLDTFVDDVKRARPTVFGSVPRLWMKFQTGVHAKLPPGKLDRMLRMPLIGTLVKRKILAGLGLDEVRVAISGSAPIPVEVIEWYRRLELSIAEVYAMTENFAISHAGDPDDYRPGFAGAPLEGVEQRISEQGEILVKSPGTMLGYYQAPEETRAVIRDGWLHTGDKGELAPDGQLKVTGRVKEQFKTSKGKYVGPSQIEQLLLASELIDQACVIGADLAQPLALVTLTRPADERAIRSLGELMAFTNARLDPHERLDRVVVLGEAWTVENGLLTPTLKLKRAAIEERYARSAAAWCAAPETVVVAGSSARSG